LELLTEDKLQLMQRYNMNRRNALFNLKIQQ
ncbi:hypothetical protein T03_7337, partial [Trichinella britovi]